MNEADFVFGVVMFAFLAWLSWKTFNLIDTSEKIHESHKDVMQIIAFLLIWFGPVGIIVFAAG